MNNRLLMPNNETIIIDTFMPSDAEGIARLFRAVYGEDYPIAMVYEPDRLIAAFERKDNVPVVARTVTGDVIGVASLYRSTPNPELYEAGLSLVAPAYRRFEVGTALNRQIVEVAAPAMGLGIVFGEVSCSNVQMQEMASGLGYIEAGLEVDLTPLEGPSREGRPERGSVLPQFRLYRPERAVVYVPAVYENEVAFLYSGFNDGRRLTPLGSSPAPEGKTDIKSQTFEFVRVARMAVFHAGADFEEVFADTEEELLFNGLLVIQVWLPLSALWVARVVDHLRGLGYFLGGLLLRWLGDDALLMQTVIGRPNWGGMTLCTDRAQRILEIVYRDWELAQKNR